MLIEESLLYNYIFTLKLVMLTGYVLTFDQLLKKGIIPTINVNDLQDLAKNSNKLLDSPVVGIQVYAGTLCGSD